MRNVVVVGGSVAGLSAADTLRAEGYEGSITVIGDEHRPAYARPPLSKGVLSGREPADSIALTPLGEDVEVRRGVQAIGLDVAARRLMVRSGDRIEALTFDGLVIATGARARVPARTGGGVHVVRTLDDSLDLCRSLAAGGPVAILGAGFLGMEIASCVTDLGLEVTVTDVVPPLRRQLGPQLADLMMAAAAEAGVQFVIQPGGAEPADAESGCSGLRLADGTMIEARTTVAAIGDLPNVEWLDGSGLIESDPTGRPQLLVTAGGAIAGRALPIVAAGDVTSRVREDGQPSRTPHWNSAITQGRLAARTLLHGETPPVRAEVPYFWTEGFGIDIRITGEIPTGVDPQVIEGSLVDRSVVLQWHSGGVPVAAATVNHRMPLPALKRLAHPRATTATLETHK